MKTITKITLIALLWLTVISSGTLGVIDSQLRLQMAHAWWTGTEEVQIAPDAKPRIRGDIRFGVVGAKDKRYIAYDPGQSMLMLPGDWLGTQLHRWFPAIDVRKLRELAVSFLIFVPLNAAVVVCCFWLLKLFGFSERVAGLSSIAWLLGTTMLHYAQVHQQNNQVLLFVTLGYASALAYVLRQMPRYAFISGLALGGALLIRITSLIHILSLLLFLIGCLAYQTRNLRQTLKGIGWWLVGFIPLILLGRIVDYVRYGSFWATSRLMEKLQLTNDPMWSGMPQLPPGYPLINPPHVGIFATLFSLAKSIFIYDPFLLPCLLLAIFLWRRLLPYMQWYIITLTLDLCLHLVAYSRYIFWHGDSAWGARYHVTSVQLLLIPLVGLLIQQLLLVRSWQRKAIQFIIALAIIVQLASVAMPMNLEIFQAKVGTPGSRFDFRLAQRIINITCLVNSSWSNLCIQNNPDKKERVEKWHKLAFWPATLGNNLDQNNDLAKYSGILWTIWLIGLICAIITTLRFVFQST